MKKESFYLCKFNISTIHINVIKNLVAPKKLHSYILLRIST